MENYVRARSLFNRKYENNQVLWTGVVAGLIEGGKGDPVEWLVGQVHKKKIMIKMTPSESTMYADLVLSVSSSFLS